MPGDYAQLDDTVQAFHTWTRSPEARSPGLRGPDLDLECHYIPYPKLKSYFHQPGVIDKLLDTVLESLHRREVSGDYVKEHYLRTFAILLCIGQGNSIYHFQQHSSLRDPKLPYRTRPSGFPVLSIDIFEDFKKQQWQFCVSRLEYNINEHFEEEDILPIASKEKIGKGGSATVYQIVVDEEYDKLRPPGHRMPHPDEQHRNTFVLKNYRSRQAEQDYKAERKAFMNLRWAGNPTPNVVAYYGCFVHHKSYNIILEYADLGTLENFMKDTAPPLEYEHSLLFWHRLLQVTHGIMTIHGNIPSRSSSSRSASYFLNGRHQDIKPANILVFSGNRASPYDYYFKIADLGHSDFQPSDAHLHELSGLDAFGTRAYGAPETYRSHEGTESSPLQVSPSADIWSLGSILSEVSVWAHYGWDRLNEYRRRRSFEIKSNGGAEGEYCFHNEGKVLKTVEDTHEGLLRGPFTRHYITQQVLPLVMDMVQVGERPTAKLVYEKAERIIAACEQKFDLSVKKLERGANNSFPVLSEDRGNQRPLLINTKQTGPPEPFPSRRPNLSVKVEHSPNQPLPCDDDSPTIEQTPPPRLDHKSSSQNSQRRGVGVKEAPRLSESQPSSAVPTATQSQENAERQPPQLPQEKPVLSVEDGIEWKHDCKAKRYSILNGREIPAIPGRTNLPSLDKRDHIFLIDNSATMKQYKSDTKRLTSLLAYILKNLDENGLDIYFTQSSRTIVNSRKSSKMTNLILQVPFEGRSDMRGSLKRVLQPYINRFGAGVPQKSKILGRQLPPQPQTPLSIYILTDALWQPTDVGEYIKYIANTMIKKNCPKEHVGISFIRFGDEPASISKLNELDHGLGLQSMGMDNIDHTYWKGNVWKMLLGPINDWYDDDPPTSH